MRIVTKTNLALASVVGFSALLNLAVLEFAIMPRFLDIENSMAERNQSRVIEAIGMQSDQVAASSRDYAFWDDSYAFMKGEAPDYEEKNVNAESLQALSVEYFVAIDENGSVVLDKGFDFSGEAPEQVRLLGDESLAPDHAFRQLGSEPASGQGLLRTPLGIVSVGYAPILTSERTGPSRGTLVFGKVLDISALREATKVEFELLPVENRAATDSVIHTPETIETHTVLNGIDGEPLALLVSTTDRLISTTGRQAIWIAMALLALGGALVIATLGLLLRRIVIARVEAMRAHLASVASTGSLAPIPADDRKDELSDTVASFNLMATQLAELREQLRRRDYSHGAADQAAGILHNLRNAVSPISTICWELVQGENAPWKQNLSKALEELSKPDLAPDRAAKLNDFVLMSCAKLLAEGQKRRSELDTLNAMVRHVDSILQDQATASQGERVSEAIDLAAALAAVSKIVRARPNISLDIDLPRGATVRGHAIALEQVLANLIVNSADAIAAAGRPGTITVRAHDVQHDGKPALDIVIHDDGEGMSAERLERLFEKGFSTRRERSGGLGLHWCANAVNAMNGRLWAESAGVDHGATLHLVLPSERADMRHAA